MEAMVTGHRCDRCYYCYFDVIFCCVIYLFTCDFWRKPMHSLLSCRICDSWKTVFGNVCSSNPLTRPDCLHSALPFFYLLFSFILLMSMLFCKQDSVCFYFFALFSLWPCLLYFLLNYFLCWKKMISLTLYDRKLLWMQLNGRQCVCIHQTGVSVSYYLFCVLFNQLTFHNCF